MSLPALALMFLPLLAAEIGQYWPDLAPRSTLAGLIEQETCPILVSKKCWNPSTELRTSRERGVGLGQFTKTARFDAIAELKAQYPAQFAGWSWDNPYEATYQLRGVVIKNRDTWRSMSWADGEDRMAVTLSAYNGGRGGVLQDRRLCAATKGCNPSLWFGNIERTSLKAKTTASGYGKSFFAINREYVRNIMFKRREKYALYLKDDIQ